MPLPALLPILASAGRVLAASGGRAATSIVGTEGMAALSGRSAAAANTSRNVSQQGMSDLIGRSSSFGDIMSGRNSASNAAQQQRQEQQQQESIEGEQRRQEAADQVTGALVKLSAGTMALNVAFLKMPGLMEKFSRSILSGQENLRKYNGEIANAFARLEYGDVVRSRQTANATSGSTKVLADATNAMADDLQELKQAGITIMNLVGTGVTYLGRAVALLIKSNPAIEASVGILKKIEELQRDDTSSIAENFIHDVADGYYAGMKRDRKTPWKRPGQNRNRGGK